ncbi:MAG: 2-oxoacid:acceptor oxidoreductase family protein [Thermoprotei archaeon]|jgi:2-oxoglutarate ferredoxin oxidoreductase subunit gamma
MRTEILIAGRGGQGILLMGYLLGYAFTKYSGKYVVQTEEYGASTRGGESYTELVISDHQDELEYFKVRKADIAIFMFQQVWDRLVDKINEKTIIIFDSSLVKPSKGIKYGIPASDIARDEFKMPTVANMIMLGAFSAITKLITLDALEKAIDSEVNPKWREINKKALHKGYEISYKF